MICYNFEIVETIYIKYILILNMIKNYCFIKCCFFLVNQSTETWWETCVTSWAKEWRSSVTSNR